jgi:hypothetical protein
VWVHQQYLALLQTVRHHIHDRPTIRGGLRWLRRRIEPLYFNYNRGAEESLEIPLATRDFLEKYYHEEAASLGQLLGIADFSWEDNRRWLFVRC